MLTLPTVETRLAASLSAAPQKRQPSNPLVPADRSLIQIDIHLLGLKIFFDAPRPKFAPKARLLISAPRSFYISRLHVIYPHDTSAQRLNRAHCLENVTRPDGSGQPVGRVVCNLQRVSFVVKRNHRRNRAENFLARDAGVVIDVIEDSGLHIVALGELIGTPAASSYFRFLLSDFKIGTDTIVLLFRNQA